MKYWKIKRGEDPLFSFTSGDCRPRPPHLELQRIKVLKYFFIFLFVKKIIIIFPKKMLDILPVLCYTIITEREGKPTKPERENEMDFYNMEQFEIMGDALEALQEWLDFEADLAEGDPWAC